MSSHLSDPLGVLSLIGPTASGKTALAVRTAQVLAADGHPCEIVNTDSMLVYRGMDIGTAKPTVAERGGVVHHLIDVLDVTEPATVVDFRTMARAAIADCLTRGVTPLLVGGSSLYVRSVLDDFDFPGTDPALRARLEAEAEQQGTAALYARLLERDPAAAAAIEPGNTRRIVRALEVGALAGSYSARMPEPRYHHRPTVQFGLQLDRAVLDARIERRVHRMWADGLVVEVEGLVERGLRDGPTASRALGYAQVLELLAGDIDETEAIRRTIAGTRRFARKQLGWFRRDPRIHWLEAPLTDEEELAPTGG